MRATSAVILLLFAAGALAACAQDDEIIEGLPNEAPEIEVTLSRGQLASEYDAQTEWLVSPVLEAPAGASRVGALVRLVAPGTPPLMEALAVNGPTPAGTWQPLQRTWSEEDHHVVVVDLGGVATGARLRIAAEDLDRVLALKWSAAIPEDLGDGNPPGLGRVQGALSSELSSIGVVSRATWGARATRCTSRDAGKHRIAVHHTVSPSSNPARQVRAIQAFHMDTRGWCDLGYHFLVGSDGRVYEGRPLHLRGAHVANQNTGSIGVSFMGCFHSSQCTSFPPNRPPEAMVRAAGSLLGRLSRMYAIPLDADAVRGHRDFPGASTSCPGDYVYARMDDLRAVGRGEAVDPATPTPDHELTPQPDPPARPGDCGAGSCEACEGTSGCSWCAASASCRPSSESCVWPGAVAGNACWDQLWPCGAGACWNPTADLSPCGAETIEESFSSGLYGAHRYWTTLHEGSNRIVLERSAGSFSPALLVTDRAGALLYGSKEGSVRSGVTATDVVSGRGWDSAEVTLDMARTTDVLVYVTGWAVVDEGFAGRMPTTARYRLILTHECEATDPDPDPDPDTPAQPTSCSPLTCASCTATSGCAWCGSRSECAPATAACTWAGDLKGDACWETLWPCWAASCWDPTASLPHCGAWELNEDFSSGAYSVHRYWTDLHSGGATTIRLTRTAGSFAPAMLITDRAGRLVYGGETTSVHADVRATTVADGRHGTAAEVVLEAARDLQLLVYVTGWTLLDAGFEGSMPTSSRYHLGMDHGCF